MLCIGHGSNGKIFIENFLSKTIIKKIKCCICNKIYREIYFSKNLCHTHILQSLKINFFSNYIHIQYPKKCMDLQSFLYQYYLKNKKLSFKILKNFIFQILFSVLYLHEQGICHRDLKLDNFLIGEYNDTFETLENIVQTNTIHFPNIYLTDLGSAKVSHFPNEFQQLNEKYIQSGPMCSLILQSPEMLKYKSTEKYDPFKLDIWCVGCIIFALTKGYYPFNGTTPEKVYESIMNFDLKSAWDETKETKETLETNDFEDTCIEQNVYNIIEMCLEKDFLKRATIQDIQKKIDLKITNVENKKIEKYRIPLNIKAIIKKSLHVLLLEKNLINITLEIIFNIINKSICILNKDIQEMSIENFYIACMSLGLDLCQIQNYDLTQLQDITKFYFKKLNTNKIYYLKNKIVCI